jgi:hypothetical protein
VLGLEKQIHVYSLDTACFYNQQEMNIHQKLLRLYYLKNKVRSKKERDLLYAHQLNRVDKYISYYKKNLYDQFEQTRLYNIEHNQIRELREECINDKNVVSIFESFLTRTFKCKTDELTDNIMIVQVYFFQVAEDIIKNGFIYNNEKYVLFSASAGQIRTKKFVVVKEKLLKQYEKTLMCGLSVDEINKRGGVNVNKFLAYYALANSATEEWEDFDIDRAIVVEDFETFVNGEVDYIDDKDYSITRQQMDVLVPHMDGCGIMLDDTTTMVRLPWIKGLLVKFDFRKFIQEHSLLPNCNCGVIKDIYGDVHDVFKEDIKYIFTASQFKMYKYYDSWNQYKEWYKQYHCTAGRINQEEEIIPNARINYQMLQTLTDTKPREMRSLARKTVEEIENIGQDYRTTMRLLGAVEDNLDASYMQKSLMLYPELMRDKYNREIIKDVKRSLVKWGKAGKLAIDGKYCFLAPDLYAFCEWLFLGEENPQGLLADGEVACSLYRNGDELDCLRSPHLYKEHAIRKNVQNDLINKWFDTKCIYTSCHDLISKYLMFDCDGDKSLVVRDKQLIRLAKRNMQDIVPLYYNMHKAEPSELNANTLFHGLELAYTGGNIGIISNNISKVWNSGHITDKEVRVVKWLCLRNNEVIDYAKTLYKSQCPKDIDDIIKSYTTDLLPQFFKYAKDKNDYQITKWKPTAVNYLEDIIPDVRIKFNKKINKFDYRMLLHDKNYTYQDIYKSIIETYDYLNSHKYKFYRVIDDKDNLNIKKYDSYIYQQIKKKLLELPFSQETIVDTLVYFLYTERKDSVKKTLWECFGKEIYNNIQHNVVCLGNICPICGARIDDVDNVGKKYCSQSCEDVAIKEYRRFLMAQRRTVL